MKAIGPRSLAGGLKVIFYIAFGLGILFFIYRLGTFAIVLKHADDLGRYTSTSIYQLPTEELVHREWRSENGRVRFTLHNLYGELRHRNLPRRVIFYLLIGDLVLFFCFFMAIIQLANLFEDLGAGKVFEADSVRRLRLVGLAVVGGTLFDPVWGVLPVWLFHSDVIVPGTRVPWLFFLWLKTNLGLLLGGLLLLVVAEAFRIGYKLHEEQQLTV
jgi:hypothetical protein